MSPIMPAVLTIQDGDKEWRCALQRDRGDGHLWRCQHQDDCVEVSIRQGRFERVPNDELVTELLKTIHEAIAAR
jgi:hypothetical protein